MDCVIFFFKQKTAYEIYQCDWSSDVCSSDLAKYFSVGKVKQDQIEDYAKRKDMEVSVVERWLSDRKSVV